MHQLGEFGEHPSNCCLDMAILLLSRWRPSAILNLKRNEILTVDKVHIVKMHHYAEFGEDRSDCCRVQVLGTHYP